MSSTQNGAQEHIDRWVENLRCPKCKATSQISLSQAQSDYAPRVLSQPAGFNVVATEFGPTFYCKSCNILADP